MPQQRSPPPSLAPVLTLTFSAKTQKQLKSLPNQYLQQYHKAFQLLATQGPHYRSLRTHRYQQNKGTVWGSSASMFLRFYWNYQDSTRILILFLGSH